MFQKFEELEGYQFDIFQKKTNQQKTNKKHATENKQIWLFFKLSTLATGSVSISILLAIWDATKTFSRKGANYSANCDSLLFLFYFGKSFFETQLRRSVEKVPTTR